MSRRISLALLLCTVMASVALLHGPGAAEAGSCYDIYGKARNVGTGWAHIVYVENDCEQWLQCTVWTDLRPQPPTMLSVAPGMTENRQVAIDPDNEDFKAFGICRNQ